MKPERDPVTCARCPAPAKVATPEGGMCKAHAAALAESLQEER